ncbi:MAG: RlmI/RlmK family 23S rRNA methyltransferase [Gammaproteobacteria bacterium]|nr:MAG: RlmI/RlmK family 23S rRNA methyltransferase [Gammaproteobacteria bacterium]
MTSTNLPVLILKRNEQRRLAAGHVWIYSNEVDTRKTPLSGFEPGSLAAIQSSVGKTLGIGYVNPHSLICARLLTRRPRIEIDAAFYERRLRSALQLRESLFEHPNYRLVYGESDGLPGLVIDRYGDVLVVQITTAGMEAVRELLLDALNRVLAPKCILLRNDTPVRALEGLSQEVEIIGEAPETVTLEEGGVQFEVPLTAGQKTGWFYDQRSNRTAMHKYVKNKRVLDVFSYIGAWGLQAAAAGASEVCCVDSSAVAQSFLEKNAVANGLVEKVRHETGDAFDVLKSMREDKQRFDVVIVDPPAFIKRRKDIKTGEQGYARLNQLALQVLAPDGILISCSCSMHLAAERLQSILYQSARKQGRQMQILERGFQTLDHPVHPAIVETAYLKAFYCRVPAT